MSLGFKNNQSNSDNARIQKEYKRYAYTHTSFPQYPAVQLVVPVENKQTLNDILPPKSLVWKIVMFLMAFVGSISFVTYAFTIHNIKDPIVIPLLVPISLLIAVMTWLQVILSMNLLKECKISYKRLSTIVLYMISAICYTTSAIAIMEGVFWFQMMTSIFGAFFVWCAFVTIFEGDYFTPSKQQLGSLVQIIILTTLWETRSFIMNLHFANCV